MRINEFVSEVDAFGVMLRTFLRPDRQMEKAVALANLKLQGFWPAKTQHMPVALLGVCKRLLDIGLLPSSPELTLEQQVARSHHMRAGLFLEVGRVVQDVAPATAVSDEH